MSTKLQVIKHESNTSLVVAENSIFRQYKLKEGTEKLENLIALDTVKNQVFQLICHLAVERQAKESGLKKKVDSSYHMAFTGNPGVGKTETARCFKEILYGLGITDSLNFIEVNRSDLVGPYIGHTEKKTKEILETAVKEGGILFIDEFHQLGTDGSPNDFGRQALNTIVSYLENYRDKFVCIAAGYPKEMADTLALDPGLQSRFSTFINFPNYTTEEMLKIFEFHCKESNHFIDELTPVIGRQSKSEQIKEGIAKLIGEFKEIGNGRAMRKLLEKTERIQSIRLYKKYFFNGACTSQKDFLPDYAIFSTEDILLALSELRLELLQVQATKQDKIVGF